jgi:hypothetical protein
MSLNNNESVEKKKKKKLVNNKPKFIKDFCKEQLENKSNKNDFLDSVFNSKDIT